MENSTGTPCKGCGLANESPHTYCAECRMVLRNIKKAQRQSKHHCSRCCRKIRPSRDGRRCSRCSAIRRESKLPWYTHDTAEHSRYIRARYNPRSRCQASGLSLIALKKLGCILTVDRIDSRKGYVRGNMQLMADRLNSAKSSNRRVPQSAVRRLRMEYQKVAHDRLSAIKTPQVLLLPR